MTITGGQSVSVTTRAARLQTFRLVSASAASLTCVAPSIVMAADDEAPVVLEQVIVTARKRNENLQNIPVAATVVSNEKLDNYGLRSMEAIAASIPQLNIVRGSSGSGATISLRGIGSTFTSIGIEQSVAVNLDGVYFGQGRIINEGFFDMRQVEILRGPQALFFGKNATAGVISFRSADPGNHVEILARAGHEFNGKVANFEGVVSGPVTDTIGLRLAVRSADMSGGYIQNVAPAATMTTLNLADGLATPHAAPKPTQDLPGQHDLSARVTAQYTPSDRFQLTAKAGVTRYRTDNATSNYEMVNCPKGVAQNDPAERCVQDRKIRQNDLPADIGATNPLLGRHGGRLYQDYDAYAVSANAAFTGDKVDITSVTGLHRFANYFLGDYDFTANLDGGTWGAERSKYKAFSQEIRAQTKLQSPFNLMGGVFYQKARLDFDQQIIFPGALEDSRAIDPTKRYITVAKLSYTDGTTIATFGQVQWKVTPELELDAGARYTHETKDSQFVQPYVVSAYQPVFRQNHPIPANQSFNDLSPEVMLTYMPRDNLTAFAGYKQGFKSGGFSGSALDSARGNTTVADLAFAPERVAGFEGGLRALLFDRTLRLAIGAYRYTYSGVQIDYFDAAKIQFITKNAASSRAQGLEFEAEWKPLPLPALTFRGTLAYNRARYRNFADAPCYGGQTPAEGCTMIDGRPIQNLSGHSTSLAPTWTGSFEADYQHAVGQNLVFGASANVKYSSSYFANPFGNPLAKQGSYATLDASLRLRSKDSRWEVALIGRNLTNKYVLYYVADAPSSGANTGTAAGQHSDLVGTQNQPRTVAVQLTFKY
jgi:outer membrane receptor protein involved in Fe transport